MNNMILIGNETEDTGLGIEKMSNSKNQLCPKNHSSIWPLDSVQMFSSRCVYL